MWPEMAINATKVHTVSFREFPLMVFLNEFEGNLSFLVRIYLIPWFFSWFLPMYAMFRFYNFYSFNIKSR